MCSVALFVECEAQRVLGGEGEYGFDFYQVYAC